MVPNKIAPARNGLLFSRGEVERLSRSCIRNPWRLRRSGTSVHHPADYRIEVLAHQIPRGRREPQSLVGRGERSDRHFNEIGETLSKDFFARVKPGEPDAVYHRFPRVLVIRNRGKYFIENQLRLKRAHVGRHLTGAIYGEISALDDDRGEGAPAHADQQRGAALLQKRQGG